MHSEEGAALPRRRNESSRRETLEGLLVNPAEVLALRP